MAGYTRQSTADIVSNAVIKAAPVNAEYNALRDAFALATGHKHDGSSTEGAHIPLIADTDALNKVVIDTVNDRISFYSQVSTGTVEQVRIQDGAIIPVTDNDIDLGSATAEFKDLYIDGIGYIDTVAVHSNATIAGTLDVTGLSTLATVDINGGNIDATTVGATTPAAATVTSLTATTVDINGGNIDGTAIGAASASTIVGTTVTATNFVGPIAGAVTGNVTGNTAGVHTGAVTGDVTGNVTAGSGTSSFNNVTINGSLDMNASSSATVTGLSAPVLGSDAANKTYVDQEVSAVLDAAPAALDTLNELAAALGDDANFSTTVTNSIATKLPLAGGTLSGALAMGTNKVTGLGAPTTGTDATTKTYVDAGDALQVTKAGDTMSGVLAMGANKITGVADPTTDQDAATKVYVDVILGSATAAATSASNAATSESNASTSAAASSNSATASAGSATSAANSLASFTGQYSSQTTAPSSPDTGDLWFDEATAIMKVYDGVTFVNAGSTVNGIENSVSYTATASQTTFNATYDVGYLHVFQNGLRLDSADYTASNGTSVVLGLGATVGDTVYIQAFGTFELADHYNKVSSDARFTNTAYVDAAIAGIVDSSPAALNTLNELAAALGDDANYATTTATTIGTKLPKSGGAMTGNITGLTALDVAGTVTADGVDLESSTGDAVLAIDDSRSNVGDLSRVDFRHNGITGSQIKSKAIEDFSNTANRSSDLSFHVRNNGTIIDAVTVDSSGNVGISVVPFTNTLSSSIDAAGGLGLFGYNDSFYVSGNAYYDGAWKYKGIGSAAKINSNSSGDITLSSAVSGSANGAITWSDNVFINSSGNVGIGTSSPLGLVDLTVGQSKTATSGVTFAQFGKSNESSGYASLQCEVKGGASASVRSWEFQTIEQGVANAGNIVFQKDGGNVGIGTSSPSTQLEIKSAAFTDSVITLDNTSSNTTSRVTFKAAGTEYGRISGDATQVALQSGNIPLAFRTNSAERLRIDSSGNVGIGTSSPSQSWTGGSAHVVQIEGGGSQITALRINESGDTNGDLQLISGSSNEVGIYNFNNGAMRFGTSATERMRIDSAGNVGIGLASNIGAALHVDPAANVTTGFGTPLIKVGGANSWAGTGSLYSIGFGYTVSAAGYSPAEIGLVTTSGSSHTKGALVFATRDSGSSTIVPTERLRIDSSGNVLVGTTTSLGGGQLTVYSNNAQGIAIGYGTGTNEYRRMYHHATGLYFQSSTNQAYLNSSGAWVNASDISIKKEIIDVNYGLETVKNLKPRRYKMKSDDTEQIGFIAQELLEQIPEVVGGKEGLLGVSYGQLTVVLTKAIQEQQVFIEALTTRIEILEGAAP